MNEYASPQELGKRRALPIMIENPRPAKRMKPSSSSDGFFQPMPKLENQYLEDAALRRTAKLFLSPAIRSRISPALTKFGDLVITKDVFKLVEDAEKHEPYIKTWDSFGQRVDELVTSEGWRTLQDIGIREGIVATGYEEVTSPGEVVSADAASHTGDQRYARVCQFLKHHIWSGSCANVTCPSAMQDGATRLLANQLQRDKSSEDRLLSTDERSVFQTAFDHLTSRDPQSCWTSGQWMTERAGGSDVRATETVATLVEDSLEGTDVDGNPLGPWRIDGFKWFSSASDSQMAILMAKTEDGGISTFFAPTRRRNSQGQVELNGVQLQRLKSKLGTHPLPTAELVLSGMRAWRVGQEGRGTKEMSAVLNITRIHTAMGAMGAWGRGLAIGRAFARVRKVAGGRRLRDVEAHARTMAENHVKYRARMMLAFFVASLMGSVEYAPSSQELAASVISPSPAVTKQLYRLLTPLAKAVCSKDAVSGLQECMESMGGVGYLENEDQEINIARLFRDANVLPIWEGTTDVLGTDIVRVLKQSPPSSSASEAETSTASDSAAAASSSSGGGGSKPFEGRPTDAPAMTAFATWVTMALCTWQADSAAIPKAGDVIMLVAKSTRSLLDKVRACSGEQLGYEARDVMWRLTWIACGILLVEDARRDGDEAAWKVALRWVFEHNHERDRSEGLDRVDADWKERSMWDKKIVFDAGDRMGLDAGKARL